MNGAPVVRHRPVPALVIALALSALLMVTLATPAQAVDDVDLVTSITIGQDFPVPDGPVLIFLAVANVGTTTATNVVLEVPVPAAASVSGLPPQCNVAASVVSCPSASLEPFGTGGGSFYFTFDAPGTYPLIATVRADQPDVDGDSSSRVDVIVVDENADLFGSTESARVIVGGQSSFPVIHVLSNAGPTEASPASVSGTVTGATIETDSFRLQNDVGVDVTDERCTVTPTTFTCAPVLSGGQFRGPNAIFYDVNLPTVPTVVVASATLTGRADPDLSNNTSTFTIDVDEPTADLLAEIPDRPAPVSSGVPFRPNFGIFNAGEVAAENLVAVLEVPADWTIAPVTPLPPGTACTVAASPRALRCTLATLAAFSGWDFGAVLTTPPGIGSGTITLTVTTTSPEVGAFPNTASRIIRYGPGGETRVLTISPDSDLSDGDTITVHGTGFVPDATVFYCQGIIPDGRPPSARDCATEIGSVTADSAGAFTFPFIVERFLVVNDVGVVDCAQPGAACGIGTTDFLAPGGSTVIGGVEFTPQAPVDDPFDARINGTVTDAEGAPVAGARVWAFTTADTWVGSLQTTTDASGGYVLEAAEPGIAYQLAFIPPAGSDLVTAWYSGPGGPGAPSRASAAVVRLSRAEPVADASIGLAPGAVLTGTVVDGSGNPIAGVLVRGFLPTDTWIGTYATVTAADGTYRFDLPELPNFKLQYLPPTGSGLAREWFDDATSRRAAATFTLTAGQTVMPDVTLSPSP